MEPNSDIAGRILRALRIHPRGMTITEIARQTHITRNSVSKHLEVLRIAGQVDMRAVGNAKVYSLAQRVPLSAFLCFTTDLIIVLDWNGTVLQINDHLLHLAGMKEEEMILIAGLIKKVLDDPTDEKTIQNIRSQVTELCLRFPIYEFMSS